MGIADDEALHRLVSGVVADAGFDMEDLVVSTVGRRSVVRLIVDGDDGVSLDAAAQLSRAVSRALDEAGDPGLGSDPYTLEVSSPGLSRPLTEPRHFRRARGRLVALKLLDGTELTGRVRRLTGDEVELLTDTGQTSVALADIRRARVQVEFAPMPASHAAVMAADGFVDKARAVDIDDDTVDSDDDTDDTDETDDTDDTDETE